MMSGAEGMSINTTSFIFLLEGRMLGQELHVEMKRGVLESDKP
jgi:hypothetical protein